MKQAIRPAIFKWRQTEPELILCAVRWYLRSSLSFRDVEELLHERGLEADHTTISRWVQRYGPELEERLRRHLKPTNRSWRVDETYVRVKRRWCYLYRAIDSTHRVFMQQRRVLRTSAIRFGGLVANQLGIRPAKALFMTVWRSSRRNAETQGSSKSTLCLPSGGVAPPSHAPGMLPRRAWPAGRLTALGAQANSQPDD